MILDLIKLMLNHKALGNNPTRKGQRVYLNPRDAESHPTTPYKGSPHECEGTVEQFTYDGVGIIRWDNGETGSFPHQRLTVSDFPFVPNPFQFYPNFDETNPNIAFKRWKARFTKGGMPKMKESYIFADDMGETHSRRHMPSSKFTKMLIRATR